MAAHPDYSYSATFGRFPGQDGGWDVSLSMERSESQSTSCTVDSNYTASASFSRLSSPTEYSSESAFFIDDDYLHCQASSYPDPTSFDELRNANHMLSATGSQYQESDHHMLSATGFQYQESDHHLPRVPQLSSASQPLNSQASIEKAAWRATLAANSLVITRPSFGDHGPSVITFEAVEEALQRQLEQGFEEPVRPAVQDILYQELSPRFHKMDLFHAEMTRILEEAAYQLQIRLQGPKVIDICYYAIVAILARLIRIPECATNAANSESVLTSNPTSRAPSEKERFKCHKCNKTAGRQADLERHFRIVHLGDDQKVKYLCDYKRCARHTLPFFRQDHFRDHLRIYHKEDLLRRGHNKADQAWWASRATQALQCGWWRCSRCLVRVSLGKHGFVCPGCGNPCEKERQHYRTTILD
ncbi:hypothetical protein N657DRAFT_661066 [Parathielavia appendiculata]|uniref:C2H2-type domain-containing protein n=1 Tax=Parathielavia appendiculata TaxID=2587402 RepID=A0AAN6U628_9PEZI|nr:hypothetical protein N657DRAFT_661066 [Parathielavia appendiculata]